MRWTLYVGLVMAVSSRNVASAETIQSRQVVETPETPVPVFAGDSDKAYRVIGVINDNLRKPFAFMANPTQEKIYAEIWERGRKMGADAVINARFGATKRTLFNHGSTPISGTAIKYTSEGKPGN